MFKKHWKFFVPILVVFALGGFYWKYQQCRIEPMIQQINSLQVDLNKKIDPKDRVLIERDRIVLQNALDSSVLQFASGLFFVITAFIAWLNLKATEEKQITERFSKAVEQLGSDKLEVRIGSIYSLERIAKDSPKDHWTVMEVLTSFVRDQSSKGKSVSELKVEEKEEESLSTDSSIETTLAKINAKLAVRVTSDIQAALTVICRRNQSKDEKGLCLDLSFSDIRGADLRKARLRNVDFRWTNLSGANLEDADLINSEFQNADLTRAKLSCAKLRRARLNNSTIEYAYLEHAELQDADLTGAKLNGTGLQNAKLNGTKLYLADFAKTKLQGTDFSNAKFKRTDLRDAQLDDKTKLDEKWRQIHQININGCKQLPDSSDLSEAILTGANLEGANLQRVSLDGADLCGANLKGANLEGASFKKTNLRTDLLGANLNRANLKRAIFERTNLGRTDFTGADLTEAVFNGVNLENANLENANLKDAKFINRCILKNTNFHNSNHQDAIFKDTDTSKANFGSS